VTSDLRLTSQLVCLLQDSSFPQVLNGLAHVCQLAGREPTNHPKQHALGDLAADLTRLVGRCIERGL
jgi:hypothetical protein